MTLSRVLVVEDEPDIAALIAHILSREGSRVEIAASGHAALDAIARQPPDLVILDLNLPGLNGVEVCRSLRSSPETGSIPIVVVSARTSEDDRVAGLDLGADDYVTKPFSARELAARVRAVLRRRQAADAGETTYRDRHLEVDFAAFAVRVDHVPVRLTRREFQLLRFLIENRQRVLSRDRLLERVWGYDRIVETRSVDVHIGRLRSKLGAAGPQIETVIGVGYRFVEPSS